MQITPLQQLCHVDTCLTRLTTLGKRKEMQKMKANFRVLTETLLQAKWQMDKKETHIDMERERYKKENGYSDHMEMTMERKDTKERG